MGVISSTCSPHEDGPTRQLTGDVRGDVLDNIRAHPHPSPGALCTSLALRLRHPDGLLAREILAATSSGVQASVGGKS
jgi:hypothetical protein